jgi:hypothetical protein
LGSQNRKNGSTQHPGQPQAGNYIRYGKGGGGKGFNAQGGFLLQGQGYITLSPGCKESGKLGKIKQKRSKGHQKKTAEGNERRIQ